MEKIIWNDSFSVKVMEIDDQHKKLIRLINRLGDIDASKVNSETVSEIFTEMTQYTQFHFGTEEKYMLEHFTLFYNLVGVALAAKFAPKGRSYPLAVALMAT